MLFVRNDLAKVEKAAGEPKEIKNSKETIKEQDNVLGEGILKPHRRVSLFFSVSHSI